MLDSGFYLSVILFLLCIREKPILFQLFLYLTFFHGKPIPRLSTRLKNHFFHHVYGLSLDMGRTWGLYISSSRGKTSVGVEEPALFTEPGVFLVRKDGTLYFASVQTMPFARPHFDDIMQALDFVIENDYPARGEVVDIHDD